MNGTCKAHNASESSPCPKNKMESCGNQHTDAERIYNPRSQMTNVVGFAAANPKFPVYIVLSIRYGDRRYVYARDGLKLM